MRTRSTKKRLSEDDPVLYSMPALQKLRSRLSRVMLLDLELPGQTMTLPLLERAALRLHDLLPERRSAKLLMQDEPSYAVTERKEVTDVLRGRLDAVRDALTPLAGQKIRPEDVAEACIRIAGWWEESALGHRRRPDWYKYQTWGLFHLYDLVRIPCKGRMFRVRIKSYAGESAGMTWNPVYGGGTLQMLIRDAGCRRYDEYRDEDAAGLWFIARICTMEGKPRFLDMCASSSVERHNKDLQTRRREVCSGPFEILRGRGTCRMCPVGTSECELSRSATGYTEVRECRGGHQGWFRPDEDTRDWCLNCLVTGKYRQQYVQKPN